MTDSLNFQSRAAAATSRVLSAASPAEAFARSLTDADLPKITDAVKSYASLVAARSLSTSPTDAWSTPTVSSDDSGQKCVFYKSTNPTKASLVCARALLLAINSTSIPESNNGKKSEKNLAQQLENDIIRMVWNALVRKSSESQNTSNTAKPSKALGRKSLLLAYPHVLKRLGSGEREDDDMLTPDGVDPTEAVAFFEEFGRLLTYGNSSKDKDDDDDDDGSLIWSIDGGKAELEKRMKRRVERGKKAVASAETQITNAVSSTSTVTIEEITDEKT